MSKSRTMAWDSADQFWAAAEMGDAHLGDARLVRRLAHIAECLSENPEESIPGVFGGSSDTTKAVYRFFDNDGVDPEEILKAHRRATQRRIAAAACPMVLVVQDTTQFDFTKHHAIQGLGATGAPGLSGFFLHSALCLEPSAGIPLGLLDWHWWVRDAEPADGGDRQEKRRRKRRIEEKESHRWLEALDRSTAEVPAGVRTLTIADREADIFEFFDHARQHGQEVLVRAHHDRSVVRAGEIQGLWDAALASEPLGVYMFRLPRGPRQPERQAMATLQVAEVTMRPPKHLAARRLAPLTIRAILLQEIDAPADQEPVQWLLLTSLSVNSAEEAAQCVVWYTYRWSIERFHFTLKSGGNYEKLQLQTADRLWRALATYLVVAWRLLYINLVARSHPDAPCTTFLTQDEWQALWSHRHQTVIPPNEPPPDARTAIRWIAQLGGFLGRKGDGEPGVKTLWRGFRRLQDLVEMWRITHPRE